MSKGAITITELSDLPINDRKILLATLRQTEEAKKKKIEELKEKQKMNRIIHRK